MSPLLRLVPVLLVLLLLVLELVELVVEGGYPSANHSINIRTKE
jgi:hypothetical protein